MSGPRISIAFVAPSCHHLNRNPRILVIADNVVEDLVSDLIAELIRVTSAHRFAG